MLRMIKNISFYKTGATRMNLIENTDNIYASYGYSTGYPFMTLHCNRQGIYLVDDLPGEYIQFDPNHPEGDRVKLIYQSVQFIPRNELYYQ